MEDIVGNALVFIKDEKVTDGVILLLQGESQCKFTYNADADT